jgi:hypothetical protein
MEFVRRRGASHSSSEAGSGDTPTLSTDLVPSSRSGVSLDELRAEWRRLYRSEAPRLSRDLLVRGIGYRRQEIERGGLGKSTRRKLRTIAKAFNHLRAEVLAGDPRRTAVGACCSIPATTTQQKRKWQH